jgi:uncharacterized protein (TIRG00374 family)
LGSYFREAVVLIVLLFALLGLSAVALTEAHAVLLDTDAFFLIVGCLFFIISVLLWLFSWAYLLKKKALLPFRRAIAVGVASFYGSLTPVQLGAEALRSLNLKKIYGISYKDSVSAAMVSKGAKFLVIGLFATLFLLAYIAGSRLSVVLLAAYVSGLFVIALATSLFLLPLNRRIGHSISGMLARISHAPIPQFRLLGNLSDFFRSYSDYLSRTPFSMLTKVFFLCLLSWLLEVAALYFSFASVSVFLPVVPLLVFATLVAVLERNPFLPRGIGLVEVLGYYFLAMPSFVSGITLQTSEIVAAIIVYDVVRLVVPTVFSMIISYPLIKMLERQVSREGSSGIPQSR